ncbi:MAG: polysaccharide deacetylase family protein [Flavobacteriales bacterium]|nr:polysaccharide deacetylase family protein [Flavobacteriales bacterium]
MFLAKSPTIIKKYYPQLVWDIPNNNNKIYLTFDDGPIPEITDWVLDLLAEYNIKATFFCIGDNVEKYPIIYQRILDENHVVGNHTFNHVNGWKTKDEIYFENIEKCFKQVNSTLFRPPYGRIKKSQLKELSKKYSIIMWDVLSGDFDAKTTPEKCYSNVIKNTQTGSVIVFHDSVKAIENLKYALPKSIEYLLEQGFFFDVLK